MQNAEVEVMISSANEFTYSHVIPGRKQYYYSRENDRNENPALENTTFVIDWIVIFLPS